MCELLDELLDECENRAMLRALKNLMKSTKFTMEQAMDALLVPNEERVMYANMIEVENK